MKKTKKLLIANLLLILIALTGCEIPTNVTEPGTGTDVTDPPIGTTLDVVRISSKIDTDQTWEADKIYYVTSDIDIEATVTIEPGCIVKFRGDITLQNSGKIIAVGTEQKRIFFTSYKNDIGGDTNGSGSPSMYNTRQILVEESGSIFTFCQFDYSDQAINVRGDDLSVTITDNIFVNNNYALRADRDPSAASIIARNRFYSNYYPITVDPRLSIGTTNMFTNSDGSIKNTNQCIQLNSQYSHEMDADITLDITDIDYYSGGFTLGNSIDLTLNENVVLKMGIGGTLTMELGASIVLNGSNSYITSYKDDTHGGDIDGQSSVPNPSTNYWSGVRVSGGAWYTHDRYLFSTNSSN